MIPFFVEFAEAFMNFLRPILSIQLARMDPQKNDSCKSAKAGKRQFDHRIRSTDFTKASSFLMPAMANKLNTKAGITRKNPTL